MSLRHLTKCYCYIQCYSATQPRYTASMIATMSIQPSLSLFYPASMLIALFVARWQLSSAATRRHPMASQYNAGAMVLNSNTHAAC